MEVEPRIAKPYKLHHCCSCRNYRGKGMECGKKVSLPRFLADQKIAISWKKMRFGAYYSTSNKLLLVARHILTTSLQNILKSWQCKIRKFTVTAFHCERKYAPEVKAAKGLKRCQAEVKGVNNPA